MNHKFVSTEEEVTVFLKELNGILNDPMFDKEKDLYILPKKKHELNYDPHTTMNTLLSLDYEKMML